MQGTEGRVVMKTTKQTKMTNIKFDRISRPAAVCYCIPNTMGEAVIDGRLAPPPTQKNLSRGRFWESQAYEFLKIFLT